MSLKRIVTRFRAYQLGSAGSSFSYYANGEFTLIEARLNETNLKSIKKEMEICGKDFIDVLHITSWDEDHCSTSELEKILSLLAPKRIETPGYKPESDCGKANLKAIEQYKQKLELNKVPASIKVQSITPEYIESLDSSQQYGYKNIYYWPKEIKDLNSNDRSTVKLFRDGSFNVLNTGDVENHNIGISFLGRVMSNELDVLVLPHHGSSNGCVKKRFLEESRPHFAICTSDYDNQFDHPHEEIKCLFYELKIPIFTTKTGDVIVRSIGYHDGEFEVINLISDSEQVSTRKTFSAKKKKMLSHNADTIRNLTKKKAFTGPRR